ncbi:uncharacterized protein LOC143912772 [Arctopsyche grandis]|uniref:uncharacterized protein LOC143912772 n=1 Tax=Arctopsyche grandis TaxID=121162 RepID=UPI00406D654A
MSVDVLGPPSGAELLEIDHLAVGAVCRLCLSRQNLHHCLLAEKHLLHKLRACLPLIISETDSLPKKVCDKCSLKISDIHEYYNRAKDAERELLSVNFLSSPNEDVLSNNKTEVVIDTIDIPDNCQINKTIKLEPPETPNVNFIFTERLSNINSSPDESPSKFSSKHTQTDSLSSNFIIPSRGIENSESAIKEEILSDGLANSPIEEGAFDFTTDNNYSSEDNITLSEVLKVPPIKVKIKKEYSESKRLKKLKKRKKEISAKKSRGRPKGSLNKKSTNELEKLSNKSKLLIKMEKSEQVFVDEVDENGHFEIDDSKKWFSPDVTIEDDKLWQCLTCFVYEKSRADLLRHYKDHVENPSKYKVDDSLKPDMSIKEEGNSESNKTTDTQELKVKKQNFVFIQPIENGGEPGFQCMKCYKVFNNKRSLNRHLVCHDDSRPFPCNICGRTYKRAYEILLHGRAHSGIKTLFCQYDQCNYSTVYPGALHTHHKRHAPDFKYTCEICNKGFDVLTWFMEHKNVHTGDKPFVCNLCGKSFIYSRYLSSHRKSVHPETTVRKLLHRCNECQSEFQFRKQLQRHIARFHTVECSTSVLCDICGKGLSSKEHLKFHRRIHTGEKPHVCRTCSKGFAKKCNLILHERVHSGEKPHICSHCGKGFAQRSTLVIHERYHSGSRPYVCLICNKGFVAKGLLSMHQKTCI